MTTFWRWWRRLDSNQRRALPGRFTVCCHCPLGHASEDWYASARSARCQRPGPAQGPWRPVRRSPRRALEPAPGIEPGTNGLQNRCSTAELCRRRAGPAEPESAGAGLGRRGTGDNAQTERALPRPESRRFYPRVAGGASPGGLAAAGHRAAWGRAARRAHRRRVTRRRKRGPNPRTPGHHGRRLSRPGPAPRGSRG